MQLKISEYDEIALIYPKQEELLREPLYVKSSTKHVHNLHVIIREGTHEALTVSISKEC